MRRADRRYVAGFIAVLVLAPIIAGCGDDDTTAPQIPAALVGTWDATSLVAVGVDLIDEGYGLSITLMDDGEYSVDLTDGDPMDALEFCEPPAQSCTETGNYTATGSRITLDPGTDETVLNYSISGNTLTASATIQGIPISATFEKQ